MAKEVKYEVPHSRSYEGTGEAESNSPLKGLLCGKNKQWIRAYCRVHQEEGMYHKPKGSVPVRLCMCVALTVC